MKKKMVRKLLNDHKDLESPRYSKMEREWARIEQIKSMQAKWPAWVNWFFKKKSLSPSTPIESVPTPIQENTPSI